MRTETASKNRLFFRAISHDLRLEADPVSLCTHPEKDVAIFRSQTCQEPVMFLLADAAEYVLFVR
jgi:hypothetical protein